MAISFNTGATADSGGSQTTSQAITIPAGVLQHDVVLVLAEQVTLTSTASTFTISSTGTTPVSAGGTNNPATGTEALPAAVTGQVFVIKDASSTDAGKVITVTASAQGFWSVALVAYTGASNTAPIDVIQGAFGGAGSVSVTCPTLSTGVANDWAVFLGGGAGENSTAVTPPSGSTLRESDNSSSQIDAVIADSNASVGPAGTSIGGGTFNSPPGSTNCILTGFTVGLAPPSTGISGMVQPRATVPVPRRRPARAVIHGFAVPGVIGVAPAQQFRLSPRRRLARSYVQFTPVRTVNATAPPAVNGTVQPLAARPAARRAPARAYIKFIPVTTVNTPPPPPSPIPADQGTNSGGDRDAAVRVYRSIAPGDVPSMGAQLPRLQGRAFLVPIPADTDHAVHAWETAPPPPPAETPSKLVGFRDVIQHTAGQALDLGRIFADPPYERKPKMCGAIRKIGGVTLTCKRKPHSSGKHHDRGLDWSL